MLRSLSRVTQMGYLYLAGLGDRISLRQPALAGLGYTFTCEWKDKEIWQAAWTQGLILHCPPWNLVKPLEPGRAKQERKVLPVKQMKHSDLCSTDTNDRSRNRTAVVPISPQDRKTRKRRHQFICLLPYRHKCQLHYFTPVFYGGSFYTGVWQWRTRLTGPFQQSPFHAALAALPAKNSPGIKRYPAGTSFRGHGQLWRVLSESPVCCGTTTTSTDSCEILGWNSPEVWSENEKLSKIVSCTTRG